MTEVNNISYEKVRAIIYPIHSIPFHSILFIKLLQFIYKIVLRTKQTLLFYQGGRAYNTYDTAWQTNSQTATVPSSDGGHIRGLS